MHLAPVYHLKLCCIPKLIMGIPGLKLLTAFIFISRGCTAEDDGGGW
jgi:hypothetical protein